MGRPRTFDIEKAVESALLLFWQKGYEGTSLADLTKTMGINPPSLYAAFGSKKGLFRAALDQYEAGRAELVAKIVRAPTAHAVAYAALHNTAANLNKEGNPRSCLLIQGGLACGAHGLGIPEELASRRGMLVQALAHRFERAQVEGDLPLEADPVDLAHYLATVIQGLCIEAAAGATQEQMHRVADLALKACP